MWKREETQERAEPRAERTPAPEPRATVQPGRGERATIGASIAIRGDVSGDEDLLIQGRIEGSVNLDQHSVTIGPQGQVRADISARVVTVEGTVEGNVRAHEQVVLRSSARVLGDIAAPRVVLEDGAYFRGGVDMGEPAGRSRSGEAGRSGAATSGSPTAAGAAAAATAPGTKAAAGSGGGQTPAQIALDA